MRVMEGIYLKVRVPKYSSVPQGPVRMMYCVYRYVLPVVKRELQEWQTFAQRINDAELKKQAMDSLIAKKFHCEGGAIYASANLSMRHILIPLIVAFQTISDYLDNLCDRSTSLDPIDFRRLHQSMLDAVQPDAVLQDYYEFHSEKDDNGYLVALVRRCQACIQRLPAYGIVQDSIKEFVHLYVDLQVYKHIHSEKREQELRNWWEIHRHHHPDLAWNEFAAATGSTLGVFMLFQAASQAEGTLTLNQEIKDAYFPYVCGLHILLDYLIDQDEDERGGDLNFCVYYRSKDDMLSRITHIADKARERVMFLENPKFHLMIIEGLLALYLSDPKVKHQVQVKQISMEIMKKSSNTRLFFMLNSLYIRATS